jgi:hypothetical protein
VAIKTRPSIRSVGSSGAAPCAASRSSAALAAGRLGDASKLRHCFLGGSAADQVAENLLHLAGQTGLVVPVLGIAHAADLVLKDPGQLEIKVRGVGVQRDALGAEQFHAAANPSPAFGRHLCGGGDVPGHVPGLKSPDLLKPRLQRRDPFAQRLRLVKLPFVLEMLRPCPENVHGQPAKGAKRRGHDGHVRRNAFHAFHLHDEAQVVALLLHDTGDGSRPDKAHGQDHAGNGDDEPITHDREPTRSRRSSSAQPTAKRSSG